MDSGSICVIKIDWNGLGTEVVSILFSCIFHYFDYNFAFPKELVLFTLNLHQQNTFFELVMITRVSSRLLYKIY